MKMLEENRPQCKTDRSRTCPFVNHYETLRLRSNSIPFGQTCTPARICSKGKMTDTDKLRPQTWILRTTFILITGGRAFSSLPTTLGFL